MLLEPAEVMLICDVPAFKVALDPVRFIMVPIVTALEPRVIVFVTEPVIINSWQLTAKLAVLNVPDPTETFLEEVFNASPSVTVPAEALICTPLNDLPAVISVAVPVNVIMPMCV